VDDTRSGEQNQRTAEKKVARSKKKHVPAHGNSKQREKNKGKMQTQWGAVLGWAYPAGATPKGLFRAESKKGGYKKNKGGWEPLNLHNRPRPWEGKKKIECQRVASLFKI